MIRLAKKQDGVLVWYYWSTLCKTIYEVHANMSNINFKFNKKLAYKGE